MRETSGGKSPDIAWSMPENLVPPYFLQKLRDGSLLIGFKGSRFHSHMFQRGNELIAVVTENALKGKKRYHKSFRVDVSNAILPPAFVEEVKGKPQIER